MMGAAGPTPTHVEFTIDSQNSYPLHLEFYDNSTLDPVFPGHEDDRRAQGEIFLAALDVLAPGMYSVELPAARIVTATATDAQGNTSEFSPAALVTPCISQTVTVTANPLWTNSGLTLTPGDRIVLHNATGSWTWGFGLFGPDGDPQPDLAYDEWITNSQHGQLIGIVLPEGVDPNSLPRVVAQNDPRLFVIGSGSVTLSGVSGRLWLGFNDDYVSTYLSDNFGSVTVHLDCLP